MKRTVIFVGIMVFVSMTLFASASSVTTTNSQYTLTATVVNTNSLLPTEHIWSSIVKNGILEYNFPFGLNHFEIKFNKDYINELPNGITVLNGSINPNFFPWIPAVKKYPWGEIIQSDPWVGIWEILLVGGTGLDFFIRHDDPRIFLNSAIAIVFYNLIISNVSLNHKIILNKAPNSTKRSQN